MKKSMAEKQYDKAYKTAGEAIENELFIYETSHEMWVRLVNNSETTTTQEWINLYKSKGFDVRELTAIAFVVSAPFKAGA